MQGESAGSDGPGEPGGVGQVEFAGCATLTPGADGLTSLHLAIDPADRDGDLRTTLIARGTGADIGTGPPLGHAGQPRRRRGRGRRSGFRPERDLLQMRVPLPLPDDIVAATRPLETRPFVVGQDDEMWLETNNRAFAGHPEQGAWTLAQLRERMAPTGSSSTGSWWPRTRTRRAGLIGSCWTKIHRDHTPVLGEIYVIDVDPATTAKAGGARSPSPACSGSRGQGHHGRHALHRRHQHGGRGRSTARSASPSTTSTAPTSEPPADRRADQADLPDQAVPMPVPIALPTPKVTPAATAVTAELPQGGDHDGRSV